MQIGDLTAVPICNHKVVFDRLRPSCKTMTEITDKLSTALADRYRIEHHLGEGSMATVYLAEEPRARPD